MATNEIHTFYRGEQRPVGVDFGENTAGQTTGPLPATDTIASATAAIDSKPDGAANLTFGTVTTTNGDYINSRVCSTGEGVKFDCTTASDQAYGLYVGVVTATTTAGKVIKEPFRIMVVPVNT
jgi:hypothetical protein